MAQWWRPWAEDGPDARDPDRAVFRRATRDIALEIAGLSAVMVIGGALLLFVGLWIDALRHGGSRDPETGFLLIHLDPGDAAELALVVTVGVVALAGLATTALVRRAVHPLEESMRRQRAFVGDASHELRTPLAVMSARAQQLAIMVEGDDRLAPVAAELRADVTAMAGIVDDMLASVSDGGASGEAAPLRASVDQVIADLAVLAAERDVRLVGPAPDTASSRIEVALPAVQLRRALAAVVDNAIGHTPPGDDVEIRIRVEGRAAEVRVLDHGPGIAGIAPERVFERFAHGTPPASGDPTRSSHGIGLALAHDVVTRHGGSIDVERTGPEGTVFRLRLPVAAARSARPRGREER